VSHGNEFREFIDILDGRGELVRIEKSVNPRFEVAQKIFECQRSINKAILFEKVEGYDIPIISNILPSRRIISLALGVPEDAVLDEWAQREAHSQKKTEASGGACKEEVLLADEADLHRLPIVTHYERDGGPYVTGGILIFRKNGVENASYNRMQLADRKKLRLRLDPGLSHAGIFHSEREKSGKGLDAAVCIGNHPHIMLAAAAKIPIDCDELDFAGGLRGESLEVVRCETVDVDIPADTEIVIEGKILPSVREKEGPFGDFLGYYEYTEKAHIFEVTAITSRKSPIYQTILAGGAEELSLYVSIEAEVYKSIKKCGLSVKDVRVNSSPCHYVVAIYKQSEDDPRIAISEAFRGHPWVKVCTVVDQDVDISNSEDVMWAISTRLDPRHGIFIGDREHEPVERFDPTQGMLVEKGKLGLDATVKLTEKDKFLRTEVKRKT